MRGGRFKQGTATLVEEYTESVSYDRALYAQDIAGSMAHARMLARQGVLTAEEAAIMAKYGYGSGAAIDIIKKELLILIGNLLYTVLSPDAEVAQRAVDVFHENATK